ncbi:2-isopropylmalate synthase (Alpha-isopropylmalate synthase) (Alpha-IPM synthetase) [Maudiozyma exigua]|uniref:2-isopropylmalate synthase n=1 Tax=Maudiozyma exigua TaxID=34358 RepID=A0A9P6WEF9_MAUEX|nr:2-isopropylmalate synthase (Alpha-isopropylmalate synthase) (Alpha-IPM synthetase) [Kazachstania exigua]
MVKRTIVALAEQTGRISKTIPSFKLNYKNMLKDPSIKYKPFPAPHLENRSWPNNTITKAPRWLSTDLRDGNQSLPDPMTVEQKKEYFHKLIEIGFKEIEVAFPSASQTDFDFTRYAVENAPEDVTIQALVQSREHLIKRTVESLKGAKRATIHTYLATSDMFREIVFSMSQEEAITKAVEATRLVRKLTKDDPSQQATRWSYEFSPECFSDTPTDFAVKICEAVKEAWEPTVENPIIFNLPATVEQTTPNVYADQIEYFSKHISEREKVCISTHCHNDRGCAVAATELGMLAGADRVEGCVFGNGERTGNVDLVTVALNMYTQGVSPNLDFSDITSVVEVSERCNKIPVSPRAPYGGDLVVCAFSGSHQDAIKKGFALQEKKRKNGDHQWRIPYLPLDPKDIGRDYEAVIRVNSQSGKGGAAWIILRALGLDVPRNMQIDFSSAVQTTADSLGKELTAEEITNLFKDTYNYNNESHRYITLLNYNVERKDNERRVLTGQVEINDTVVPINGVGNGPVSSIVDALSNLVGVKLSVEHYSEHAIGSGTSTKAASFVQLRYLREEDNGAAFKWGVGLAEDVGDSSVQAILATLNNIIASDEIPVPNVAKKAKKASA